MAKQNHPERVVNVESLPRSSSGKVWESESSILASGLSTPLISRPDRFGGLL